MRKILILLLFFGFSFGQVKSIYGVYSSFNHTEFIRSVILNSDNTGIYTLKRPGNESNYDITWEIRIDKSKNGESSFEGLLIMRPTQKYNDFSIIKKNFKFTDLSKDYFQDQYKEIFYDFPLYTGKNKILYLWNIGDKFLDDTTFILEGF